jgi:hypothetical protein
MPSDAAVALTLSDPFCVEHHRNEFLELLNGDLEILFANEEEVMMLFGSPTSTPPWRPSRRPACWPC